MLKNIKYTPSGRISTEIECTCKQCGKTFFEWRANVLDGITKYCSRACLHEARRKQIPVTCEICGTAFTTTPSKQARGQGRYCSRKCFGDSKRMTEAEFWALIDKSGGPESCWPWTGPLSSTGYGKSVFQDTGISAHRVAWQYTHGGIDSPKVVVRHKCHNRKCCNPEHLELGSQLENVRDGVKVLRHAWGERHANAKLTAEQVTEIRQKFAAGGVTKKELGKLYGIQGSAVSHLVLRRTWKHLP